MSYDYCVIGCGGIGSATLYWLSKVTGQSVLGIEQFKLGHDNGGSQDHSRIIRKFYHEDRYTKLVGHTYDAWHEVEKDADTQLVYKTGGLDFTKRGPREAVLNAYCEAMDKENIKYRRLSGKEISQLHPQFATGDDYVGLYDEDAGLVDAAKANATHIQLAKARGATIKDNCKVSWLNKNPNGSVSVYTCCGMYICGKVIVTAGAWINHILGSTGIHLPMMVTQEQVTYLDSPHPQEFTKNKYPVWIYHDESHDLYGLPIHNNGGVKIGIDAGGPPVTPETRNFVPDPKREELCIDFLKKTIPKAVGPIMYTKTCLYTMPPDRNFIVDTLKKQGYENIIVCCGAGHAFKFACLLGKILSQLAVNGKTQYDISSFSLNRKSLMDPTFKQVLYVGNHQDSVKNYASKL